MLRLGLVWLVCSLSAVFETTVGVHAAAINGCDRKICQKTETVYCENQMHLGAPLSCCGGKAYNPATATCCKEEHGTNVTAVVNKGLSEMVSACCGLSAYNPLNEICCDSTVVTKSVAFAQCCAVVNKGLSEMVSACCGLSAYNPLNEICCDSTVVTKSVAFAQCCGREAYDEHEQLCCGPLGNRIVQWRESRDHQCCEHKQFNTTSQCCCSTDVSLKIHEKHHECCMKESDVCGNETYYKHSELCCQLTVVTKPSSNAQCCGKEAYDEDKQLCCGPLDNRTVLRRESCHHQCCGHKQFNTTSQCCCSTNGYLDIHPKHLQCCVEESDVCGNETYYKHSELCCQLTVVTKPSSNAQCCGKEAYDEDKQLCCGPLDNRTVLRRESRDHQCCGHKQFDTTSQCCCSTNGYLDIHPKHLQCCVEESDVCGNETYYKHTQLCCQLTVVTKPSSNAQCCGKEAYDEHKQLCCGPLDNRTVLRRESCHHQCCGHKQFDTTSQCCCLTNGYLDIYPKHHKCSVEESGVQPPTSGPRHTCTDPEKKICGSSCYNPKEFRCCEKKQFKRCCTTGQCDAAVYNPETDVCCDGHVRKLRQDQHRGSPDHCCGTEVYWPHAEICCDGHRHRHREKNAHCCGAQAYNIKDTHMKCCAGTLYNLTVEHGVRCCGSILQKQQDVCCSHEDKKVLWPAKAGFRCCGHLYYNTSLWDCCAGKLSPIHRPGRHQTKTIEEDRLQSLNNLSGPELCTELKVGTVESVSPHSIVFPSILKIHGEEGVVEVLPSPQILNISDHCNFPTLIPGKTYFFSGSNIFTDPNHDSVLESITFIFCKCGNCSFTAG